MIGRAAQDMAEALSGPWRGLDIGSVAALAAVLLVAWGAWALVSSAWHALTAPTPPTLSEPVRVMGRVTGLQPNAPSPWAPMSLGETGVEFVICRQSFSALLSAGAGRLKVGMSVPVTFRVLHAPGEPDQATEVRPEPEGAREAGPTQAELAGCAHIPPPVPPRWPR